MPVDRVARQNRAMRLSHPRAFSAPIEGSRSRSAWWLLLAGLWTVLLFPRAAASAGLPAAAAPDQDIVVRVQKAGPEIIVDVDCPVSAPVPVVWDVLTDYDHMATFVSNLQFSGIQNRADNVLTVRQTGKVARGPFTFTFDSVREVRLVPLAEIRSRLISGDLKASVFVTRILDLDGQVHISNSGRYTPNVWVPPVVGTALIEGETRKQYAEIRAEIMRRAARQTARLAERS